MEISIVAKSKLNLKGKNASISVTEGERGFLLAPQDVEMEINGPGEYEIAGVKVSGTAAVPDTVYDFKIDGIVVMLGKIGSLFKFHQKLKEANILIVSCDEDMEIGFITSIVSNVIIFTGDKAKELSKKFGKESLSMSKYQTKLEKLPAEIETIILE